MSAELRDTRTPYTQATSGTTSEQARWVTCSDVTNSNFPMPTSALFVEEVFPEENKVAVSLNLHPGQSAHWSRTIDVGASCDVSSELSHKR